MCFFSFLHLKSSCLNSCSVDEEWSGWVAEELTNQNIEKDYDSDEVVEDEESGPDQLIQTVLLEHPPRVAFTRVAEHGPEQLVHRPTHSEAKPRTT